MINFIFGAIIGFCMGITAVIVVIVAMWEQRSREMTEIPKIPKIPRECFTCAYMMENMCHNEFSDKYGEQVEDKDGCKAWSLDDLVKKIYECI